MFCAPILYVGLMAWQEHSRQQAEGWRLFARGQYGFYLNMMDDSVVDINSFKLQHRCYGECLQGCKVLHFKNIDFQQNIVQCNYTYMRPETWAKFVSKNKQTGVVKSETSGSCFYKTCFSICWQCDEAICGEGTGCGGWGWWLVTVPDGGGRSLTKSPLLHHNWRHCGQ